MADPLSVAASVVGLLATAAQVSMTLHGIYTKSKAAPKALRDLKSEVDSLNSLFMQVQQFLTRKLNANPSGSALILIDQVLALLSSCVLTFSDLEVLVEGFDNDSRMNLMDRARWLSKNTVITEMTSKMQSHKLSLVTMLTLLQSQSQLERDQSVDKLIEYIGLLISANPIIEQRLSSRELEPTATDPGIRIETAARPGAQDDEIDAEMPHSVQANKTIGFSFQEELYSSRVYKRIDRDAETATLSMISSAGRSASWSMLSGLSLSEVSHISVLALPIYAEDLENKERYHFGDVPGDGTQDESLRASSVQTKPDDRLYKPARPSSRKAFKALWRAQTQWSVRSQPSAPERGDTQRIFGVALSTSMAYANVAISVLDENNNSYIFGYVPVIVAKVGVFVKKMATETELMFTKSGHVRRIDQLQSFFDLPKGYGKGLDWTGYTTFDAGSVLLRYLKMLPEPVVPYDFFEAFCSDADSRFRDDVAGWQVFCADTTKVLAGDYYDKLTPYTMDKLARAIMGLPPLHKHLLEYLTEMLLVFRSYSHANGLRTQQLVWAFQPSILSRRPIDDNGADYDTANAVVAIMIDCYAELLDVRTKLTGNPVVPDAPPDQARPVATGIHRSNSVPSRKSRLTDLVLPDSTNLTARKSDPAENETSQSPASRPRSLQEEDTLEPPSPVPDDSAGEHVPEDRDVTSNENLPVRSLPEERKITDSQQPPSNNYALRANDPWLE